MSPRACVDCGAPERRGVDEHGRPTVNLDPTTGRCLACIVKAAAAGRSFHSRREDRKGQVVDPKALAARNEE